MDRSLSARTTVSHAINTVKLIEMAYRSRDPLRRAQILAEAQPQLAWALTSAIAECQEGDHKRTWAEIGQAVGIPRETVFRQFQAGGPIVTTKATQSAKSPAPTAKKADAAEAIYAFQTDDGNWFGSHDILPSGEYTTAVLHFRPVETEGNPFANQFLRVRVGHLRGDVTFHAAQVLMPDGRERRVRVTSEVLNLLFEDGQTPLRRALTELVHATVGNPGVDPAFREIVEQAAQAQGKSAASAEAVYAEVMPTAEFIAAVEAVVAAAPDATPLDIHAAIALRKLESVIKEYKAWAKVQAQTHT